MTLFHAQVTLPHPPGRGAVDSEGHLKHIWGCRYLFEKMVWWYVSDAALEVSLWLMFQIGRCFDQCQDFRDRCPQKSEWRQLNLCIRACASSMSCQSRQLLWSWCSNPVHIDHQHRTESTHAGVASDHCERTIPFLVSILDKRVSPSHCWKPRKLEFGRHLKPCVGKILWLLMLLC